MARPPAVPRVSARLPALASCADPNANSHVPAKATSPLGRRRLRRS